MNTRPLRCVALALALLASAGVIASASTQPARDTIAARIAPPPGHARVPAAAGSFAAWLRALPLREAGTPVRYHDGRVKPFQGAVHAVVDIDTGSRDLQQCADAVIRLRAEYLWAGGCADDVAFDFTSGHPARWAAWRDGLRPVVSGQQVAWVRSGRADSSYAAFRTYLDTVFMYAGSLSLERELAPVAEAATVRPGDVYIQGGSPGHAVLVVDVAADAAGRRVALLAQSFMPAQDIHVLANPARAGSPWFEVAADGALVTAEWTFGAGALRRFGGNDCAP